MQVPVTALYAGLLAIFALALSFRAGTFRGKAGVSILYGEPPNMELAERVRVHQNFLEYVPLAVILMGVIELNGGAAIFLHLIGIGLLVARVAHAAGLKHDRMDHPGRAIGAGGTALLTVVAALYAIWMGLGPMLT
ncbi:MAG: MAPEG family protein [Woeseiaceae bacterium]|nr:MAPEG family protein [Woeseiaceae bacterium]